MRNGVKWALIVAAGVVAAALLVVGGLLLGMDLGGYQLQREVLEKLESGYYKDIEADALEDDAVVGMLTGLDDPYTFYLDPEEYAVYLERMSGSYSGVGMVVEMNDGLVTIVSTFDDSPAQLAGIRSGDVIVAVDGVSVSGQNLDEVVTQIRGAEGAAVTLEMYRLAPSTTTTTVAEESGEDSTSDRGGSTADLTRLPPGGTLTTYTLTRKSIAIPTTERETLQAGDQEVAYISFTTFTVGSALELRAEVMKATETDGVDAIVLDLRSNVGGILTEAVAVASIFVAPGQEIVRVEGRRSPREVYYSSGDAYYDVPLYVLTDEYTASASEIVSGALQHYDRATLVGETTFGKGLVQIIQPLSDGGALKFTSAVYFTPDGRDINQTGITPDVEAPDDPETTDVDEGLEAALDLIAGDISR
jgi:carboxyl-terminal processing protease